MSALVPNSFYSVTPNKQNRLLELLQQLGEYGGEAASVIDKYATNAPAGSLQKIALGADANTQMALKRGLGKAASAIPGVDKAAGMRFAMNPMTQKALRIVPGLSFLGAGLGAADVLVGDDSVANRGMDAVAMGVGGFLGAAGGPVGIAAGASLGKAASDATQFLLGGGKSAEERKLEEALIALRGGNI